MIRTDIHIHSRFSDGLDAPRAIVEFAASQRFDRICITDHVRMGTPWLDSFFEDIGALRTEFEGRVEVLAGIEAKVLDLSGRIDADLSQVERADLVLASFHRIPGERGFFQRHEIWERKAEALDHWAAGMRAVLSNAAVDVIAHPGNILKQNRVEIPRYLKEEIALLGGRSGKVFEHNLKYGVPDEEFRALLLEQGVKLMRGSDAHSIVELAELWQDWPDD